MDSPFPTLQFIRDIFQCSSDISDATSRGVEVVLLSFFFGTIFVGSYILLRNFRGKSIWHGNRMITHCHYSHATDKSEVLLYDGEVCFRAFHMRCLNTPVNPLLLTEKDDNRNGNGNGNDESWFCPYCTALVETVHYVGEEYRGDMVADNDDGPGRASRRGGENGNKGDDENDDDDNGDKNRVAVVDDDNNQGSEASWEGAEDVFPEAETELELARKREEGERDENSDIMLCCLLGLHFAGGGSSGSGSGNGEVNNGNDGGGGGILSYDNRYDKEADGDFGWRSSCEDDNDYGNE